MMNIRKILVPTDFSKNSLVALEYARDFAKRFDAEILLVHVFEPPPYSAMTLGGGAAITPVVQEDMRQEVTQELEKIASDELADGVKVGVLLRDGSPFVEIIATAKEEHADLIVIATHGHTGIKHLLLGSTAEKVVRRAPCLVLTVRSPED
jgi:universal stress protein A